MLVSVAQTMMLPSGVSGLLGPFETVTARVSDHPPFAQSLSPFTVISTSPEKLAFHTIDAVVAVGVTTPASAGFIFHS